MPSTGPFYKVTSKQGGLIKSVQFEKIDVHKIYSNQAAGEYVYVLTMQGGPLRRPGHEDSM